MFRSVPSSIRLIDSGNGYVALRVDFGRMASNGKPVYALVGIRFSAAAPLKGLSLTCRQGTIEQLDDARLRWRLKSGERFEEVLESERTGAELLLDHFARRIVGGLVPVPAVDDVCRIRRLLQPHLAALEKFVVAGPV
jgi:hypothetical protein